MENKPQEIIYDILTGETTVQDYNDEQLAELESAKAALALRQVEAETRATARQEILDRLGLTADEAALLLG
jgi:hypothetical protein